MRATHATRKKTEYPYTLDDTPLTNTSSTSYLEVEQSSDLRWNKQVKKTAAKGNQMLGVLKRNLRHCPQSIKDMTHKTILRPKLEYASAVWDPLTEDYMTIYLKNHIAMITNNPSKISGVLHRLKYIYPQNILETIYKSLFVPHINYGLLL